MRIIVIGAVAAGTSAAAKARRNREDADIVIYERDRYISYSGCGMPYYLGGEMSDFKQIIPRDVKFFRDKYQIDVFIEHEVMQIDPAKKRVLVRKLQDNSLFEDHYDKLVIATGARSVRLPLKGNALANVFTLRSPGDAWQIDQYIKQEQPKRAVIIGSGFIGLEMLESLVRIGLEVTLIEKLPRLNPNLDADMSKYLEQELDQKKISWHTDSEVTEIIGTEKAEAVRLAGKADIPTDLVLVAVGIRPETKLAETAGIKLGKSGAIKVSPTMETNLPDIYACGDCCEQYSVIDGLPLYRPLGSTANKMGRIAGDQLSGGSLTFKGIAGTGIFRVFDLTVAQTGMTEKEARQKGYDPVVIHNIKPDRPTYIGGQEMIIKAIADKQTERLLGVQIIGHQGVDKRIDVFATALTYQAHAADLADLDLAYAPPYATTKDPVIYTGMILDNALSRGREMITVDQLEQCGDETVIIDTRSPEQFTAGHVRGAVNIPHAEIRRQLANLPRHKRYVTYCNRGTTGNAVQNILLNHGYSQVQNLSGGHRNYCCQTDQVKKTPQD